jgi:transketolase
MFAPHNKIDNLIAFIDDNGQQIDGPTTKVLNNLDLGSKYQAFGWEVLHTNGNDMDALNASIEEAKSKTKQGKPIMVIMKTEMGQGVDFMMHSHKWHGVAPNDEQLATALAQLEETLGDY